MNTVTVAESFALLQQRCRDKALYAFGTAFIFEERAARARRGIRVLTYLGIGVPLFVGAVVLTYGINARWLPLILAVAGSVLVVQLTASGWALVADWGGSLAYAAESIASNHSIANRYESLVTETSLSEPDFRARAVLLDVENEQREAQDYKQDISEKEKRLGHRAGLRQYQRKCVNCGKVPGSLKPSACPTCGNG